jgi:predicted acyl esterase
MILTEGILRARYPGHLRCTELLEPEAVYELRVDLWATANVFLAGHAFGSRFRAATSQGSAATATWTGTSPVRLPVNTDRRSIGSSMTRHMRLI